ncbi:MAG: cell division protein FtsZ [Flavobacteriales bacterium]|jgi:cell division protein FtsZ|nr:cell division protein FtsZ [Flavobacteriales bacterium]
MSTQEFDNIAFDLPKHQSNVIKVIGVGGGGSNAVNQMYKKGISGVDFIVCNTDAQALNNSPVPNKIQLGVSLTEGLGAGANPEVGEQSALENINELKTMLDSKSKMIFITVGMGGGTGTGAAPVIAKLAKELNLLTVGIVTIPFIFEGKTRNEQAQKGVEKLRQYVDSIIIINNNKLREVYGNLGFKAGFSKADEVLSTAARGIAEVITHHYTQNIDLRDAKTVLSNSGTAIMGSAEASGANRAQEAITRALDSPLLNDNKITGAKNVLLLIVSGSIEITIDEIGEINDYIQTEAKTNVDIIMGVGEDETLGEAIAVTIIATGFNKEQQHEITNTEAKKIVHTLEDEQEVVLDLTPKLEVDDIEVVEEKIIKHTLFDDDFEEKIIAEADTLEVIDDAKNIAELEVVYDEVLTENIDDFVITSHIKKEEIILDEIEEDGALSFDFPINERQPQNMVEETEKTYSVAEINDIEVVDAVHIKPEPTFKTAQITYSLEDYLEIEKTLDAVVPKLESDELKIELKTANEKEEKISLDEDNVQISPLDITISELKRRTADRKRKMVDFNFKFKNRLTNIDEIEKEPAYKRMGVDLNDNAPSSATSTSRTTLNLDENDDIQLRSNNSFLHDNVD